VIVRCEQVSKRFGARLAVDALDLTVEKGQCFGLLGPNGAGKTTALKMIYGVARPSAGRILVFDQDVTVHTREIRARLGVTLQENALIEVLSPVENLRVFGRYHVLSPDLIEDRIESLLDFLDLRSHAHVPVRRSRAASSAASRSRSR
jgi:lipooligosaccharide transport system ATP-binding protein